MIPEIAPARPLPCHPCLEKEQPSGTHGRRGWRSGALAGIVAAMKQELDVRGLSCPLPVLKARKRLKEMASGDILVVHATDPGSQRDFEAFADTTGHVLLATSMDADVYTFEIRRR